MFSLRNKKNIETFWLKKHLIQSYEKYAKKYLLGYFGCYLWLLSAAVSEGGDI